MSLMEETAFLQVSSPLLAAQPPPQTASRKTDSLSIALTDEYDPARPNDYHLFISE
jgi:hypothetical protein